MNNAPNSYSRTRKRLMAAVASLAVVGTIGAGMLATGTAPVLAEAVRVEAPQMPSFADVVEHVSPAVVSVKVKAKIQPTADDGSDDQGGFDNLPDNPQLRRFFKEFRGFGDQGQGGQFGMRRFGHRDHGNGEPRPVAQGSGFFISEDGYLVTNNHVVSEGSDFTVVTNDGKELDAKLIGTDPRTDLAVLKVDGGGNKFTYVDFADDSKVRIGDWVVAVGNPFGLGGTVTAGIVSARGRDIGAGPYDDFIQIDASVNRGNSGGPTFNLNGQVIGINTAIYSPNGGSVGVGFAIPSDQAEKVVAKLMKGGDIEYGYLGVQIQPVTPDVASAIGLDHPGGALVSQVTDGSPAAKAGIETGDVITGFGGQEIKDPKDLSRAVADVSPGAKETVNIWRKGKATQISADVGRNAEDQKTASSGNEGRSPSAEQGLRVPSLGLGLTDLTPDIRDQLNLAGNQRGAVVERVNPDKAASAAGIQPGDVIVGVDQTPVKTARQANQAIAEAGKSGRKSVLLLIDRGDAQIFVAVPFAAG
ncbi:MAG: DegQ family serine endoprotease [Mesorhizobium sp.]|nr:MAG: DegQ family serine endoprotease [Mesorhizobium sp.]